MCKWQQLAALGQTACAHSFARHTFLYSDHSILNNYTFGSDVQSYFKCMCIHNKYLCRSSCFTVEAISWISSHLYRVHSRKVLTRFPNDPSLKWVFLFTENLTDVVYVALRCHMFSRCHAWVSTCYRLPLMHLFRCFTQSQSNYWIVPRNESLLWTNSMGNKYSWEVGHR